MKRFLSVSVLLLLQIVSFGQAVNISAGGLQMEISAVDTAINAIFCKVGELPEFPGGMKELVAFAKRKIKYPKSAIKDDAEGSVVLSFEIDSNGRVINEAIFKSARYDFDAVCLRMLKRMPKWIPGRLNGKPVAVKERWRITFCFTD